MSGNTKGTNPQPGPDPQGKTLQEMAQHLGEGPLAGGPGADSPHAASDLQAAALAGQNSLSSDLPAPNVEQVTARDASVPSAQSFAPEIIPLSEARVDRVEPSSVLDGQYKYMEVETQVPPNWGILPPLYHARAAGWELVPGEDPTMPRVRVRKPMADYLKSIRTGEQKAEAIRTRKNPDASVDKTTRSTIQLSELFAGSAADSAEADKMVKERLEA